MATKRTTNSPEETTVADPVPSVDDQSATIPPISETDSDYVACEPILHDGEKYLPGKRLPKLTDDQAEQLLKAGVIIQGKDTTN